MTRHSIVPDRVGESREPLPMAASATNASVRDRPGYSDRIDVFLASQQPDRWRRVDQAGANAAWTYVFFKGASIPAQGWKLHVSAMMQDSDAVLAAFLDVVSRVPVSFKVAKNRKTLQDLNSGMGGLSQIGKFITVYPHSDQVLQQIARLVDEATQDLRGPDVPSDLAYREGSLVFFRFGDFTGQLLQQSTGELVPAIRDPDGNLIRDVRETAFAAPPWAVIPFANAWSRPKFRINDVLDQRLLINAMIMQVARGNLYLAIDLKAERLCVLKTANHNFQGRHTTDDARSQLLHEAEIIGRLRNKSYSPGLYGVRERPEGIAVEMEFVEGQTFSEIVASRYLADMPLSREEMIRFAVSIADVVADMHREKIAHGDLKSSNIMLSPAGKVRLIDFGLSQFLDNPSAGKPAGTRGYYRAQGLAKEVRPDLGDLYALGAFLFFLATGAEPALAPDENDLLCRPLSLLNPALDRDIAGIIEQCLAAGDDALFISVDDVCEALRALDPAGPGEVRVARAPRVDSADRALREGTELLLKQLPHTPGLGPAHERPEVTLNPTPVYHDVNKGLAGVVIALARIAACTGAEMHRTALRASASELADIVTERRDLTPGLYAGTAGMLSALLLAGDVLDSEDLKAVAHRFGPELLQTGTSNPDLFVGLAGIIRAGISLHASRPDPSQLGRLDQLGMQLVSLATADGEGGCYWTIPAGYAQMSGNAYLGFAHGAAGIADVLIDLYQLTGNERVLHAILGAADWLTRHARRSPSGGLYWSTVVDGPPSPAFWCHGATGIGSFFARLAASRLSPQAIDVAKGAAAAVSRTTRRYAPNRCHGLAGSIEFMMEMFEHTREQLYVDDAQEMSALAHQFYRREADFEYWQTGHPGVVDLGYMTGLAGLLSSSVRTAMAGEFSSILRI